MASIPSDRSKAITRRKVRVVAKIRGFADTHAEFPANSGASTTPRFSVNKPNGEASESVTIFFPAQSGSCKEYCDVDYCYDQQEDNDLIFSREIKPLIFEVFEGCNPTIIACGGRRSGKTYLIQGSNGKPGLATLAVSKILSMADQTRNSITISFYEVYQEHVHDLLDPKQPVVSILEDKGKIQHKGLSQVPIRSIAEFYRLYFSGCSSCKSGQKPAIELPRRSHRGLVINVLSSAENSDTRLVGKMNFVDLAGYEDARRKSTDGINLVESAKINKSIYAMYNVIYSLNANERHVPYRESKITHMLKDSFDGMNRILMFTCLNPSSCQDSVYMLSLASRSCRGINRVATGFTKEAKSMTRPMVPSSQKNGPPGSVPTNVKKKNTASQVHFSKKKTNVTASTMKGRKLFDEASCQTKSEKAISLEDIDSADEPLVQEEVKCIPNVTNLTVLSEVEAFSLPTSNMVKTTILNKDVFMASKVCLHGGDITPSPCVSSSTNGASFTEQVHSMDKENQSSLVDKVISPPLSARLRELSNNLKSLWSSTPLHIKLPEENDASSYGQVCTEIVEPKTPMMDWSIVNEGWDVANVHSPWETLSMRNSGMKNSIVQDYLKFLNTADKEDLKRLKGIGEKRATSILELREESSEPFKSLDDLKEVGLSAKQIKGMMKKEVAVLFN
ncbi:kinesin-like protein KIN-10C [Juglans microcarpa x Juglans regia]|uniref:kinesin-like protein KIN-10C n=1 Tax=Juglans microcarpa x Juglans regia TaxID=2249226 RepID=UPI001B7E3E3E|nr:kinesin-like protein KIN-10C [Juglans microcarpa x Juglans regia]